MSSIDSTGLSRSVPREILALAIPVALQSALESVMFATDTKMVAHYAEGLDDVTSGVPLATLAITGPIAWSLTVIFSVTSIGATAVVARRHGSGRHAGADRAVRASLLLAVAAGVLLAVFGSLFSREIANVYLSIARDPDPWLEDSVRRYLIVYFALFPIRALAITYAGVLRGRGDARTPFIASIFGNVGNVTGNVLFIFGTLGCPELGAAGAAAGLCLGSAFELVVFFAASRARSHAPGSGEELTGTFAGDVRNIARVSLPALADAVAFHAGFIVYQAAIVKLPLAEAAAHRVAITAQSVAFLSATAFAASGASISGRMLGASNVDGARAAAWLNAKIAFLALVPVGALFLIFGEPICSFFADSDESAKIAATCLVIGAFEVPFLAATEALRGTLRGAGRTRSPLLVTLAGTWGVRAPGAWILSIHFDLGLQGVWIAAFADWIVRSVLLVIVVRKKSWAVPGDEVEHV